MCRAPCYSVTDPRPNIALMAVVREAGRRPLDPASPLVRPCVRRRGRPDGRIP